MLLGASVIFFLGYMCPYLVVIFSMSLVLARSVESAIVLDSTWRQARPGDMKAAPMLRGSVAQANSSLQASISGEDASTARMEVSHEIPAVSRVHYNAGPTSLRATTINNMIYMLWIVGLLVAIVVLPVFACRMTRADNKLVSKSKPHTRRVVVVQAPTYHFHPSSQQ